MSAVMRGFSAPARFSGSRMGKPVELFNIVPGRDRNTYKHKIFWASQHSRTADQYNSVVTILKNPCVRRWLEFNSGRVPAGLRYATCYAPDAIKGRPERYWTIIKDGEPFASFTNCAEAWLIVLTSERMSPKHKWALFYTDRSGK